MRLRPGTPLGSGGVVLATPEAARPHEIAVYEQVRPAAVGFLARDGRWWDRAFDDREHVRDGATSRRHALHREQDGSVTGYATYRLKDNWSPTANESEVRVVDVLATTPEAYAALFSFLAGIDLHPKLVRGRAPLDDPLQHLLFDVRALQTDVYDSLWVRLADVGRALAERTYSTPVDVVLEVADEFCPWNAGRWRLSGDGSGARCERSTGPGRPGAEQHRPRRGLPGRADAGVPRRGGAGDRADPRGAGTGEPGLRRRPAAVVPGGLLSGTGQRWQRGHQ